jgi:ElaB/YqjD/DUF883 family membrane-anchored ribosome-binding protein
MHREGSEAMRERAERDWKELRRKTQAALKVSQEMLVQTRQSIAETRQSIEATKRTNVETRALIEESYRFLRQLRTGTDSEHPEG